MLSGWLTALEARHLADLTFSEAARALRALSSNYVERRDRLQHKSALDTKGKRAAYALYYSPLHFITTAEVVRGLGLESRPITQLLDLGCGAGAAGAAWASAVAAPPEVMGIDVHPWALAEAQFTYHAFGLRAHTRRADAGAVNVPRPVNAVVAGWMTNELSGEARQHLLDQLLQAAERGTQVLVIEPISTRVSPWWPEWARAFEDARGRADEWRFRVVLPDLLRRFDRAAGLRHDELTARTLYLAPDTPAQR
jgi:hypothetical protein